MSQDILQEVLELLQASEPTSRNRNFKKFEGVRGQRLHRLFRVYLSLLGELELAVKRPEMKVRASQKDTGLELTVENTKISYRRVCVVPPQLSGFFMGRMAELGLTAP